MSRPINYPIRELLPSDPTIDHCPASEQGTEKVAIESSRVSLTVFPEVLQHPYIDYDAVAAIGPIACEGCVRVCRDAYLPLGKNQLDHLEKTVILQNATLPVWIPLLEGGTLEQGLSIPEFGNEDAASTADRVYGWNNKLSDEIVNDLIDAYAADLAMIDPWGEVSFHNGPFYSQDELPFPAQPQSAAELSPTVTQGPGQQQLF